MRPPRSRFVTVIIATVILAVAFGLVASACSFRVGRGDDEQAARARTLKLARYEFSRAADALRAGDRAGFSSWLPVDSAAATSSTVRKSLDEVYQALAPLPWRTFSFEVTPLDPGAGLYRVRGSGQLGPAGPPDRIAVVRYLVLKAVADGAVVLADKTPGDLRRRYLMALHDPAVLQRPGLLVLGDRRAKARAETVMAAAAAARPRLAALGVSTRPAVVITVFGSAEDVRAALGIEASSARLIFFAYPALRVAAQPWPIKDVGVMGPWLRDAGDTMESVLTHELAHTYTVRWFAGDDHAPALLVEGIAQAAEGAPSVYLRDEVATGDQLWPLPESFASDDLWAGNDGQAVKLGYEIGGSLIDYVLARWGAQKLRPFVQAVAAAEPTEAGLDGALGDALGVSWRQFYAGWRKYVLTGT